MSWENKRLDFEYGPTVPAMERFKQIARSPELMRKLEERLDRNPHLTVEEKRRAMAAVKRMAGIADADDMAPLVDELRRLTAMFA